MEPVTRLEMLKKMQEDAQILQQDPRVEVQMNRVLNELKTAIWHTENEIAWKVQEINESLKEANQVKLPPRVPFEDYIGVPKLMDGE